MTENKIFRLGELFCGPGGLAYGAVNASIEDQDYKIVHQWANDYDEDTCKTYTENISKDKPESVVCGDVRELDISKLKPIDAFAFGFPCNDFSIVGEQKGFGGSYGPLYQYGVNVLHKFHPKWFLAENVGGLRNANEGIAFKKILTDLQKEGYRIYPHLYMFEKYGVPQARHRVIIIGIRSDLPFEFKPPSPAQYKSIDVSSRTALECPPIEKGAFNNESTTQSKLVVERLKHIKPGENAFNANLPEHLQLHVKGAKMSQIYKRLNPDLPAYTVTGSGGGGTHIYHYSENRALTNRERARLQTFPDSYHFCGSKESVRKQIGMAVPCKGSKIIFEAILRTFAGIAYDSVPCNLSYILDSDGDNAVISDSSNSKKNLKKRKVWFVTRPQRDPTYHRDALIALDEVTEHFTLIWAGNRPLQKDYEAQININKIKRENISNDGSGGRTWAAMLYTFGYVYLNDKGQLKLTKCGEKILKGENVKDHITKQILTLQIPNAYFLSSGFNPKFEDGFKIRPARFLIRLLCDSRIEHYLTKDEIIFFAMTAKTDDEIDSIIEKILRYRKSSSDDKNKITEEVVLKYDHRNRSDASARDFREANGDVAHTFMMMCRYTGLAQYEPKQPIHINPDKVQSVIKIINEYDSKCSFKDPARYPTIDLLAQANGLDINSFKVNNYRGIKPATNSFKKMNKARAMLSVYPNPYELEFDKVVSVLCQEFTEYDSHELANEIMSSKIDSLDDDFAKSYLSNQDNLEFEDQTGKIMESLGFNVMMRKRPDNNVSTEIEILAMYGDNSCCLVDAKNYHDKFSLSANLVSHMSMEYIPNYDGLDGREVTHFLYVVSNKFGGVSNLAKISANIDKILPGRNIKGAIISGRALLGLLDYCSINDIPKEERCKILIQAIDNRGYSSYHEILDAAKVDTSNKA